MKNRLMAAIAAVLVSLGAAAQGEAPFSGLPALPGIPAAEEAQLAQAANAPGGTLVFANPTDAAVWPMLPAEEDGFTCLTSTNWGADSSVSAVHAYVEAKAGDVLSFAFKTSMEAGYDLFQLSVDGEVVKVFSGEADWRTYAYAFPADAAYDVAFRYSKDTVSAAGSDAVYIRDVQLLSGDAALQALAANPVYPAGGERSLTVASAGAREIVFDDPSFALTGLFGLARYYIVPGGEVQLHVTLSAEDDPDGAVIRAGEVYSVAPGAVQDGYILTFPLTDWAAFTLTPSVDSALMDARTVVCFPGEEATHRYLEMLQGNGYPVAMWRYAELIPCAVTVIDQHGEFLQGVEISLQTWAGAAPLVSDAEGVISFAVSPGETAQVRIVSAPEGFAFDAERVWMLDAENPEAIIDLTRLGE